MLPSGLLRRYGDKSIALRGTRVIEHLRVELARAEAKVHHSKMRLVSDSRCF